MLIRYWRFVDQSETQSCKSGNTYYMHLALQDRSAKMGTRLTGSSVGLFCHYLSLTSTCDYKMICVKSLDCRYVDEISKILILQKPELSCQETNYQSIIDILFSIESQKRKFCQKDLPLSYKNDITIISMPWYLRNHSSYMKSGPGACTLEIPQVSNQITSPQYLVLSYK